MVSQVCQEFYQVLDGNGRVKNSSSVPVAILLFLFFNCVYLLTSTGRVRSIDEIDPVMQSESILLRHSTAIPQAVNSGIYFGKSDQYGVPRSAWPAGHAILVLPWSAAGHYLFAHLPGITNNSSDLAVATAVCWSSATFAAFAVAASFLLFLEFELSPKCALACCMMLGFSTPLFVYSGWLYSEPATIAIFVTTAFLLFGSGMPISLSRAVIGSLLLGFAVHIRPANMVTAFVFIAASLVYDQSHASKTRFAYRTTALLISVLAFSGLLYLARNYSLFGNPFDFGVPATAENGKDLDSWHNPFWVGAFGFLFSPGKSVLLFCPPIILGILGLPRLWRRNRGLSVLCGAAPIANLFLYSVRTQWEGGYCYGPRYLVPSLILLTLPCAALFQSPCSWVRPAFWITAIIGFLVQALGLSTNIVEDMVVNHYFIGNWDYRMTYSPIAGQIHLIWKYLHVKPAQLGLGWDRWFVFLRAAGASPLPLTIIASIFLLGMLTFGHLTWKTVRSLS
jgi:hypothetical protein